MTWRRRAVLLLLAGLLLLAASPAPALARIVMGGGVKELSEGSTPLTIEETDGTPSGPVTTLKVSPGTLTLVGEEATLVTSGGGLAVSGTPVLGQLAAFINPTTVEGVSTITLNYAAAAVNTAGTVTTSTEYVTTGAGGVTRTLPAAASGTTTRRFTVLKVDAGVGALTVAPLGADTINGVNAALPAITAQWAGYEIQESATNGWVAQPISSTAATGATFPLIGTSSANPCFAVGPNGATNPSFAVDCSVASAVTGIGILPTAVGGGPTLTALSSGTNEPLSIQTKGISHLFLKASPGGAGGTAQIHVAGTTKIVHHSDRIIFTPGNRTSTAVTGMTFTAGGGVTLTAGTEVKDFVIDLSATNQHNGNTAITLQRHMHVLSGADTCSAATCTITENTLLALGGPPMGGTNSTVTRASALLVETRALTNVATGVGLIVNPPTGATTNLAAQFLGTVQFPGIPALTGTRYLCIDTAGNLTSSASACSGT